MITFKEAQDISDQHETATDEEVIQCYDFVPAYTAVFVEDVRNDIHGVFEGPQYP